MLWMLEQAVQICSASFTPLFDASPPNDTTPTIPQLFSMDDLFHPTRRIQSTHRRLRLPRRSEFNFTGATSSHFSLEHRISPNPTDETITTAIRYNHQALNPSKTQIRLLRFSSPDSRTIDTTLSTFDLDDCPPYTALSYMWGPPTPTREILIDGCAFSIRENLWDFLDSIRRVRDVSRIFDDHRLVGILRQEYIWIDQICIQQDVSHERSHQVKLMGQIYQKAIEVVIWLGSYTETHLSTRFMERWRRPYWQRLWVIQEIMLAQEVFVVHDDALIPWDIFFGSLPTRSETRLEDPDIPKVLWSIWRERNNFKQSGQSNSLSYVIELFSIEGSKCEDQRDKVYGLLGLVKDSATIDIDYEKTAEEVCLDILRKVIHDEIYLPACDIVEFGHLLQETMGLSDMCGAELRGLVQEIKKKQDIDWRKLYEGCLKKAKEAIDQELERHRLILATDENTDFQHVFDRIKDSSCREVNKRAEEFYENGKRMSRKEVESALTQLPVQMASDVKERFDAEKMTPGRVQFCPNIG